MSGGEQRAFATAIVAPAAHQDADIDVPVLQPLADRGADAIADAQADVGVQAALACCARLGTPSELG